MGKTPSGTIPPVIADVLKNPQNYTFTQIIHLLCLWLTPNKGFENNRFLRQNLRFRPALSLGFAPTDVESIKLGYADTHANTHVESKNILAHMTQAIPIEDVPERLEITATFYGLYGTSSPLPKSYTEQLLAELADDSSVKRDFLDIINNQFYLLHTLMLMNVNPWYKWKTTNNHNAGHMLMALAGYGTEELRHSLQDEDMFLRCSRFFFHKTRSASGLKAMLCDIIGWKKIRIFTNELRIVHIADYQRFQLGTHNTTLSRDCSLGDTIECYNDKLHIEIYDVDAKTLHRLRPNTKFTTLLHSLIINYCRIISEYEITLSVCANEAQGLCLGGVTHTHNDSELPNFACLGHNTWLSYASENSNTCMHPCMSAHMPKVQANFQQGFAYQAVRN